MLKHFFWVLIFVSQAAFADLVSAYRIDFSNGLSSLSLHSKHEMFEDIRATKGARFSLTRFLNENFEAGFSGFATIGQSGNSKVSFSGAGISTGYSFLNFGKNSVSGGLEAGWFNLNASATEGKANDNADTGIIINGSDGFWAPKLDYFQFLDLPELGSRELYLHVGVTSFLPFSHDEMRHMFLSLGSMVKF